MSDDDLHDDEQFAAYIDEIAEKEELDKEPRSHIEYGAAGTLIVGIYFVGIVVLGLVSLRGIILTVQGVNEGLGLATAIVSVVIFPITLFVSPFYVGLALDDWTPALWQFGALAGVAVLHACMQFAIVSLGLTKALRENKNEKT